MIPGERRTAAVVIPARLGARRFPRKVLARETGKYLVEHVWERVVDFPGSAGVSITRVVIATDSDEVYEAARSFGAQVCMTSPEHLSGTDRVAEVARELDDTFVINVQGDEPLIAHEDLGLLLDLFEKRSEGEEAEGEETVMTTLATPRSDREGFRDPNIVKAVIGRGHRALYFSRSPVPYAAETGVEDAGQRWWQHIGIYAYRRDFLLRFASLEPTTLEKRERLEQLRALDHGYAIRVGETHARHLGIDTEAEYRRFVEEVRQGSVALGFGRPGP
jgi:3-deoxy-manno-octulosonate cytidylyltransferase (CMP-KDO synthetase)